MAEKKKSVESASPASDKKKALETAMAQIERAYGKGSIMRLGENAGVVVDAIPTGSPVSYTHLPIIYQGTTVGVIRFVTSMAAVDRQLFLSIGVCTLIGIAILTMVYFSNLYFCLLYTSRCV